MKPKKNKKLSGATPKQAKNASVSSDDSFVTAPTGRVGCDFSLAHIRDCFQTPNAKKKKSVIPAQPLFASDSESDASEEEMVVF